MKKTFVFILSLVIVLSVVLCACGNDGGSESGQEAGTSANPEESKPEVELGETYEYTGTSITLPKDFEVKESSSSVIATPSDYPAHADNITMTYEKHSKISDIKEAELLELIKSTDEEIFASLEKFDVFTNTKVGEHDALIVKYSIVYSEMEMKISQCSVGVSGGVVTYTFTSVTGEYDDEFEKSLESIKVTE